MFSSSFIAATTPARGSDPSTALHTSHTHLNASKDNKHRHDGSRGAPSCWQDIGRRILHKRERERDVALYSLERPRRDTNGGRETKATVTSQTGHKRGGIGFINLLKARSHGPCDAGNSPRRTSCEDTRPRWHPRKVATVIEVNRDFLSRHY